jgi:glycosyltransferase involved in cell wall biosynthesis
MNEKRRVAIVTTHPIQYYAPWFRWIAGNIDLDLKVFYLWDFGVRAARDPGFQQNVEWDVPLLEGYEYEFVPNVSASPGSVRFFGIDNPELFSRLRAFAPDAALLIGYRFKSMMKLLFMSEERRGFPLIMRGDSHRIADGKSEKLKTETLKAKIRRRAITAIFKRFSAFLYVGEANREYLRIHGVPDSKLFFSPHAVDNERFMAEPEKTRAAAAAWRLELGIPSDQLLVMFAGKFEKKKRPLDLLAAFQHLDRKDVSLLFVGSGALEVELRDKAGSVRNVFFAPFQNQSQMPRTYGACDLFVLPSFGSEETWGLAINEAFCLKKPVIVSDHVGCAADLVRPGQNGLIFPAGNVGRLASALADALSDQKRLAAWAERGREIVSHYDFAAATRGLIDAINAVTTESDS